ncbi:uncharacterized protein LOC121508364 isoform X2 [Cheilinus undulatus]|uniref:uncharacterized protein LOC121508364 isoform X2 n=1 Tax=Cheilinus undulatus TaxID=241271 RepID=UPI001BD54546|nr:uncharacterized protein LOC121508364 isoform X2 [Cheilinus undulatus]
MPRTCVYPGCSNKHTSWTPYRFHRIPLRNIGLRRLWLVALKMDINTPPAALKKHIVCSAHFTEQDYLQQPKDTHRLKNSAVPIFQLKDDVDGPDWLSSTGTQVPETCTEAIKKLSLHHIVEEEAILQLMRNCPMCNRMCRCSKRINGAYLIIYQSCYFCQYSRKWANQPGATDINIQKAKKQVKKKRQPKPKKKEPEKAEAEPVKQEEEESAVSEWLVPL